MKTQGAEQIGGRGNSDMDHRGGRKHAKEKQREMLLP